MKLRFRLSTLFRVLTSVAIAAAVIAWSQRSPIGSDEYDVWNAVLEWRVSRAKLTRENPLFILNCTQQALDLPTESTMDRHVCDRAVSRDFFRRNRASLKIFDNFSLDSEYVLVDRRGTLEQERRLESLGIDVDRSSRDLFYQFLSRPGFSPDGTIAVVFVEGPQSGPRPLRTLILLRKSGSKWAVGNWISYPDIVSR